MVRDDRVSEIELQVEAKDAWGRTAMTDVVQVGDPLLGVRIGDIVLVSAVVLVVYVAMVWLLRVSEGRDLWQMVEGRIRRRG